FYDPLSYFTLQGFQRLRSALKVFAVIRRQPRRKGGTMAVLVNNLLAVLFFSIQAHGAGVTVITHGHGSSAVSWVAVMGGGIAGRAGDYTIYLMAVNEDLSITVSVPVGNSAMPFLSQSGEIVILVDWSAHANFSSSATTADVASLVASKLLDPVALPYAFRSAAEYPLHLIGHSRGGSLVCGVALELGKRGVVVDHVTTLDPYPLGGDAPATAWENIRFFDNYFQAIFPPEGLVVAGAYNRQLGYLDGATSYTLPHSDTHLWYYGTVAPHVTPLPYDDGLSITASERFYWYASPEIGGYFTGHFFSRVAGGSDYRPFDGYLNRTGLPSNTHEWPNVVDLWLTNSVARPAVAGGVQAYSDGGGDFFLGIDNDGNPANGIIGYIGTNSTAFFIPTNIPPGSYQIFAHVINDSQSRFLYAPGVLEVKPALLAPSLQLTAQKQLQVQGYPGQTVVIEASQDLQTWTPLKTNSVAEVFSDATVFSRRFYRARLIELGP
ncbi:MAG: hypothetical protein AB1705_24940, partial [Verrucomicrobiota bacterium]